MILVAAAATERVIGELDVIGEPEIPAVARVAGDRRTSSLDLERERRSRASGRASCIGAQRNQQAAGDHADANSCAFPSARIRAATREAAGPGLGPASGTYQH